MTIGVPGENWSDALTWRGSPALPLQRLHREWVGLTGARAEFQLVMNQYGGALGVSDDEVKRTAELGMQALDLAIAEVRDDNLVPALARVTGEPREALRGLTFSQLTCDESPFGACAFEGAPAFGDPCVFCGLSFR